MATDVEKQGTPEFRERGATGLKRFGGRIDEEFLNELRGERGRRTIIEMRDNEPVIGSGLLAFETLLRSVTWKVEAGGSSPADAEAADFLASIPDDMTMSWSDTISEILSMLQFGWSFLEIVWKRRLGREPGPDPENRDRSLPTSNFADNRIGVRKLAIRAQESLDEWIFDPDGGVRGLIQDPSMMPQGTVLEPIPIEKALLFRTTSRKNNPEGRSLLRIIYRPWFFKKNIQEIEAIGIERELAGFPVAGIPARLFRSTDPGDQLIIGEWERTVRDLRRDHLDGLVMPLDYDESGNPLYKLELLSTSGRRQIDVSPVVERYNVEMAVGLLVDFLLLGHEAVGSFALAATKSDLFSLAANSILGNIADVLNRHLVPRLFTFETLAIDQLPKLVPNTLETVDLKELGDYITSLSGVGHPLFPNEALEGRLLQVAGLPEPAEGEQDEGARATGDAIEDES